MGRAGINKLPQLHGSRCVLLRDNGNVAGLKSRRGHDQQGGIQDGQFAVAERGHVVAVDRPGRVDLLDEGLQFRLLLRTPGVLLEGRLIDEAVPVVRHAGAIGEFDREGAECRPGPFPGAVWAAR